jgi:hypothetical protein
LAVGCTLLPLIPLPAEITQALSPQRVALEQQFHASTGPSLLSLTVSTTASLQRLADLALILAAFWLARRGGFTTGFIKWLILALSISVGLLAASEVWFKWGGETQLLGILPDRSGHAAGTFPNRNHFAGYVYVTCLFLAGWLLRQSWPLRFFARLQQRSPAALPLVLLSATLVFGLIMATRSGSRGGLLSFLVGALVWLGLLTSRSPSRHRQLRLFAAVILVSLRHRWQ